MDQPGGACAQRLHLLDALRGLAALAVVVFHWQHFALAGQVPDPPRFGAPPFWPVLAPFYLYGSWAVNLFFAISGYVFFWLYERSIAERRTDFRTFAILRWSRLYPLHLATLIFVLAGQQAMLAGRGSCFIYRQNDTFHFILNLLFASHWGLQAGWSFNGPAWSVSIEVLLYAIFFGACRLGVRTPPLLALVALLGFLLSRAGVPSLGYGMLEFFLGALAFKAVQAIDARHLAPRPSLLILLLAGLWTVIPVNFAHNLAYRAFAHFGLLRSSLGRDWLGEGTLLLTQESAFLFLFPLTILLLVLIELRCPPHAWALSRLGEISYSSYLLHFPLQLASALLGLAFGWDASVFNASGFFLGFFAALIALSWLSYRYFELPAQRFLRRRLLTGG